MLSIPRAFSKQIKGCTMILHSQTFNKNSCLDNLSYWISVQGYLQRALAKLLVTSWSCIVTISLTMLEADSNQVLWTIQSSSSILVISISVDRGARSHGGQPPLINLNLSIFKFCVSAWYSEFAGQSPKDGCSYAIIRKASAAPSTTWLQLYFSARFGFRAIRIENLKTAWAWST